MKLTLSLGGFRRDKLKQDKLFDDRVVATVGNSHPLAKTKSVPLEQIKPFGWILPPPETTMRRQIDQYFTRQDQYAPPFAIESVSYLANRALLQTSHLIGLMPAEIVQKDVENGDLTALDWDVPFGQSAIGMTERSDNSLSPAGQAFKDALHLAAKGR